jgi:hypothetical protein
MSLVPSPLNIVSLATFPTFSLSLSPVFKRLRLWLSETNSVQRAASRETDSCSATQEIPHVSCNSKVHDRVHKISPLISIQGVHIYSLSHWPRRRAFCHVPLGVLINYRRNSMQQSASWETYSGSAGQGIHQLLQDPKVQYCVRKSSLLVPILSQMNPIHHLTRPCFKIHFNVILEPTPSIT